MWLCGDYHSHCSAGTILPVQAVNEIEGRRYKTSKTAGSADRRGQALQKNAWSGVARYVHSWILDPAN